MSLSICPIVGMSAMFMSKYARKVANKQRLIEGESMNYVLERFEGLHTVRLNDRTDFEREKYSSYTQENYSLSANSHFSQGMVHT